MKRTLVVALMVSVCATLLPATPSRAAGSPTLDAIRDYPHFPEGSRTWDERVYHPDSNGDMRPLSTLWRDNVVPRVVTVAMRAVRLMGARPVSSGLRMAWSDTGEMRNALAELDA